MKVVYTWSLFPVPLHWLAFVSLISCCVHSTSVTCWLEAVRTYNIVFLPITVFQQKNTIICLWCFLNYLFIRSVKFLSLFWLLKWWLKAEISSEAFPSSGERTTLSQLILTMWQISKWLTNGSRETWPDYDSFCILMKLDLLIFCWSPLEPFLPHGYWFAVFLQCVFDSQGNLGFIKGSASFHLVMFAWLIINFLLSGSLGWPWTLDLPRYWNGKHGPPHQAQLYRWKSV